LRFSQGRPESGGLASTHFTATSYTNGREKLWKTYKGALRSDAGCKWLPAPTLSSTPSTGERPDLWETSLFCNIVGAGHHGCIRQNVEKADSRELNLPEYRKELEVSVNLGFGQPYLDNPRRNTYSTLHILPIIFGTS